MAGAVVRDELAPRKDAGELLSPLELDERIGSAVQDQRRHDVIERGVRMGAFSTTDPFLDAKTLGAMAMRLPEWWTPESPRTREEIMDRYSAYALKLIS
ncbi:MAG: Tetracyclin repressor-like, C-terminal domain [Actinomycetota bacterium]|nr:Tetracyclin repressor-like, C-terminal domain [Actinomycetota bacterium]